MQKNMNSPESIRQTITRIGSENLELIDFDQLESELGTICADQAKSILSAEELRLLKSEYASRIIGMVKANLACRKTEDDTELAVRLTDDPDLISSSELIEMYRKTVRRFRKNFPATFNYLGESHSASYRRDWREHKI